MENQLVFHFTDYREYLKEVYSMRKERNKSFSHRLVAQKLKLKSTGHFSLIISGKANISDDLVNRFNLFFKHSQRESDYFQHLVHFCQSKTASQKAVYFKHLQGYRESIVSLVRSDQYEFYRNWYYSAVRDSLMVWPLFSSYKELARRVHPPIKTQEAKEAIEILQKLKMIQQKENKSWVILSPLITTGNKARSELLENYIMETLDLAKDSLVQIPYGEKNHSSVSMALSEDGFQKAVQELREFRKRIFNIIEDDEEPTRVYNLNLSLYPTSQKKEKL